ncbi:COPII subunit [Blastocladiella emersonii ATCC 22665]|nr:COPII subunit [Blastocladiella emersonii ATCC 22665]
MHRMYGPGFPGAAVPGVPPTMPAAPAPSMSLPTTAPRPPGGAPPPAQPPLQQQPYGQPQYYPGQQPPQGYPSPAPGMPPQGPPPMQGAPRGFVPPPTQAGYPQQQQQPPQQQQGPPPAGPPPSAAAGYAGPPPAAGPAAPPMGMPATPQPPAQQPNGSAPSPNAAAATGSPAGGAAANASTRRRLYPDQMGQVYTQPLQPPAPGPPSAGVPNSPYTGPGMLPPPYQQQGNQAPPPGYQQQQQQQQQQDLGQSMGSQSSLLDQSYTQLPQPNTPMPLYPKATYGSTMSMGGSVDGLANSFSHLGVGTPIMQPVNNSAVALIGAPPTPHEVHNAPPAIRLSPQAACTMSPHSNCSPTYKRATMNVIPQTAALLAKSKVPLALYIAPFRAPDTEKGDPEIPVINTPTIVRCRRCRTYINPYVQFLDRGQRWKCNMCYFPNDVPEAFDFDVASQSYIDRWQRPELNHAVVEFIAPSEYMLRPPQPPVFIFVIDVSYTAVQTGMLHTVAQTLRESLDKLPNADNRTLVGFITVDSTLHFYNLGATLTEPQMLVVSDLDDVFLPLPEDLLVNLTESKPVIEALLERLPALHQTTQNVSNALGPALLAAHQLVAPYGGKIVVCQSSIPNAQAGALKPREGPNADKPGVAGAGKLDPSLLQPADPFYKTFAVDCSRNQVSVDLFLFAQGHLDLATLAAAPRFTAGNTYLYPQFHASRKHDVDKFANEFAHVLGRPLALEAVLRVRASRGVRMAVYHGNFFVRSTDLLALPNVNPDNTYNIELAIDENIQSSVVCFQTALLHTTATGERRIRVLTLALPVTTNLGDLLHSVDTGAVINLLARKAVERVLEAKFEDARDAIVNKAVDLLGVYKGVLGSSAHAAQLVAPENLKLLPLLSLALSKHPALRVQPGIPADVRAYYMEQLRVASVDTTLTAVHPVFYPLHRVLLETADIGTRDEKSGRVVMPPYPLPVTSERLERNGVYLVYDTVGLYLWVSRAADPQMLQALFGVAHYDHLTTGPLSLPATGHPFADRLANLVAKIRDDALLHNSRWPTAFVVKEDGDPALRMWTLAMLVEDRHEFGPSLPQFLNQLREKVAAFS